MANRANKPAPLTPGPNGPQPIVDVEGGKVIARLPSGESVEVYLYGATITSWRNDNGSENLWVSENAVTDGSKAIRGGVPVVFPVCSASKFLNSSYVPFTAYSRQGEMQLREYTANIHRSSVLLQPTTQLLPSHSTALRASHTGTTSESHHPSQRQ